MSRILMQLSHKFNYWLIMETVAVCGEFSTKLLFLEAYFFLFGLISYFHDDV